MSWAYAYAFNAGKDHETCEDAVVCEALGNYLIAAVADGAGSADKSHDGASIACHTFLELAVPLFDGSLDPTCLVAAIRDRIPKGEEEAHSCTLVGAVAGPDATFFLQVGDGAGVFRVGTDDFEVAIWPEETEFLNHTFFVTMPDAEEHLHVRRVAAPAEEIALFTDGMQHLVLDLKTRDPHQPFFKSVFTRLGMEPQHDLKASWWLERTLASEAVTKRTDDDTSLVVARRLPC